MAGASCLVEEEPPQGAAQWRHHCSERGRTGRQQARFAIDLARKLRQRVQELTEKLEVFAPVYIVFTKADLIAGFVDFFEDRDRAERDKVWGATLCLRWPQSRFRWRSSIVISMSCLKAGSLGGAHVAASGRATPPGVDLPLSLPRSSRPLRVDLCHHAV